MFVRARVSFLVDVGSLLMEFVPLITLATVNDIQEFIFCRRNFNIMEQFCIYYLFHHRIKASVTESKQTKITDL